MPYLKAWQIKIFRRAAKSSLYKDALYICNGPVWSDKKISCVLIPLVNIYTKKFLS